LIHPGQIRHYSRKKWPKPIYIWQLTSSAYSRNPENIEQLMTLTRTFIQTPMVVSLDPARYWHNEQF
jgi:hypothetical protein